MKMIFTILLAGLAMLGLSACSSIQSPMDDGYQFGDLTGTALELQARYCANADPYQRAVALALMSQAGVPLPERGACTDIIEMVPDGSLDGVDTEAAKEDQERFGG